MAAIASSRAIFFAPQSRKGGDVVYAQISGIATIFIPKWQS
jgi:hypothetical protein